jgi:hypothetical protein
MEPAISLTLVISGLINFLPIVGIFGSEKLDSLYGITIKDADLLILMRHRAILFGLIGTFMLASTWVKDWQIPAMSIGLVSMLSFVGISQSTGTSNVSIKRIEVIDTILSIALTVIFVYRVKGLLRGI